MKRLMSSTCLAAAFAVGLAAQSTSTATTQDPQGSGQRAPRSVTATGCLRAGDTAGTYMLTDVQMQGGGGRRGGDTTGTTAGGGTTAGTTAGGGTTGTTGGEQARGNTPTTLMLNPAADVDLKAHVGHKIEVTGTAMGGRGGAGGTTTGTTTGTTATGGTTGGGTTTGTAGGTSAAGGGTQAGRGMRNVTVTSVRMISESCS